MESRVTEVLKVDRTQIPKTIGRFGIGFLTTHLFSDE